MRYIKALIIGLAFFCVTQNAQAADRTVGVGKTHTTINSCLAAAAAGDRCLLTAGETFTECVVLPNKGNGANIIIRSDTADANLPNSSTRIDPAQVAFMATITACPGGVPAITTVNGAQDYVVGPGIRITSTPGGFNQMVRLGDTGSGQQFEADQPQDITFDRVWFDGDALVGQKVGIDFNGRNLGIVNSYMDDIFGIGQDAIGVRCVNGTGPYVVYNNYISAAAENFLCGGADPQMYTNALVTASTTTTATLGTYRAGHSIATAKVGQLIAFLVNNGADRVHTYIRSCGAATTTGATCGGGGTPNNITFDALAVAPTVGATGDARWGAIPDGFTIRRNYFFKPLAWLTPILGQVGTVTPTASTASGALTAGTYFYRVVGLNPNGYQGNTYYSTGSTEISSTLTATGNIALAWSALTNATKYRIYRSTTSGTFTSGYFEVTTNSATDTGQTLTSGSIPTATSRVMKNAFEIKFGTHYQIDSNYFKNAVTGGDIGYCIWLKSNNSGGTADYAQTKDVVFEKNVIESCPGFFNILGRIDAASSDLSAPLENLTIRNNLGFDSNSNYLQGKSSTYAIKIQSPTPKLTIENNTFIHTMRGFIYFVVTGTQMFTDLVIRNNIGRKETYGLFGSSCVSGTECIVEAAPNYVFAGNVLCDADPTKYPAGNLYPTCAVFESSTHFNNYAANDFLLKTGSSWKGTGVGGVDPGANIPAVLAAVNGVTTGAAETAVPPNITTTTPLPTLTQGAACTTTFAATGGTSPYTWTVRSGAMPTGCSVSSAGVSSGTTTTPGTFTYTLRATDSTAGTPLWDEQTFTRVILPSSSTLNILTTTLSSTEVALPFSKQLDVTGGTAPYTWSVNAGSTLPTWATLSPSGLLEGVPDVAAISSFTVKVTDSAAATDTQVLSLTAGSETMACARTRRIRTSGVTIEASIFRRPSFPTAAAPDCAMKGDRLFHTGNGLKFVATASNPIVWSLDSAGGNTDTTLFLTFPDGTPPSLGDIPVGTEDGGWEKKPANQITGLNASTAFTEGTIPAARLPATAPSTAPTFYTLGSDVAKATTGFGDITGLSFPVLANTNYDIVCQFAAVANTNTTGWGVGWVGPASPTLTSGQFVAVTGSQSVGGSTAEGNDTGNATSASANGTPQITPGVFMGMWRNGATAGTIQMRFRPEIADTVTIKAGSYCKVTVF